MSPCPRVEGAGPFLDLDRLQVAQGHFVPLLMKGSYNGSAGAADQGITREKARFPTKGYRGGHRWRIRSLSSTMTHASLGS